MVGGIDLRRGSNLGAIADADLDDIQDDAVEVEEHTVAETDVITIVTKERRPDHDISANMSQTLGQQRMPLGNWQRQRAVVAYHPDFIRGLIGRQRRIAGPIKFARKHFLLFGFAQPTTPSFGNASGAAASAARARALSSSI